jgi:hypothetical protein
MFLLCLYIYTQNKQYFNIEDPLFVWVYGSLSALWTDVESK